jgi:hypothetical protein
MKVFDLTYKERYDHWFSNNYETGMEYNLDIVPNFDDHYYQPTPIKKVIIEDKEVYLTKEEWREYSLKNILNE